MLKNDSISPDSVHYALARNEIAEPAKFQRVEGIGFYGIVSNSFRISIIQAYKQLPQQLRLFISGGGGRIAVGDYITRIWPDLANILREPTVDDPRTHCNHSPGCFDRSTKEIVVAQFHLDAALDGRIYRAPRGKMSSTGLAWKINMQPQEVLRHEIGHRINADFWRTSDSPSFCNAWKQDVAALGGETAARRKKLGYFIQDGSKGRSEVFAELWAHEHGGGLRSQIEASVHGHFLCCHIWMKEFLDHFHIALSAGEKAILRLAKDYQNEPDICAIRRAPTPLKLHLS